MFFVLLLEVSFVSACLPTFQLLWIRISTSWSCVPSMRSFSHTDRKKTASQQLNSSRDEYMNVNAPCSINAGCQVCYLAHWARSRCCLMRGTRNFINSTIMLIWLELTKNLGRISKKKKKRLKSSYQKVAELFIASVQLSVCFSIGSL